MNIQDTLNYIHNVKWQGSKPGLERTRELLKSLGNPEEKLRFVHVAGTNGKGSTCACIASILQKAGYRVGLYTSPYIMTFNERMQVNREHITDDELIRMTEEIKPYADAMVDPPTEFEMITALAMKHFLYKRCDIVVLETGMGGELDSTNVISTPELAIITAIDYDHVRELGPTLQDIARAKAGIIKNGGDVLIYDGTREVESVFESAAAKHGAKLYKADFARLSDISVSLNGTNLDVAPYGKVSLPLAGSYQPYNMLVAITAAELLRKKGYTISDDDIIKGIADAKWPARFEFLCHDPVFILDGAHNVQGVTAATHSLRSYYRNCRFIFIVGMLEDKDINAMAAVIAQAAEIIFTVKPDNPRGMDAHRLANCFSAYNIPVTACNTIDEGVERAFETAKRNNADTGIICALGSLFLSADIKTAVEKCIC